MSMWYRVIFSLVLLLGGQMMISCAWAQRADSARIYQESVWSVAWICRQRGARLVGWGSGVLVRRSQRKGLVVTCAHVVEGAGSDDILVFFPYPNKQGQPVLESPVLDDFENALASPYRNPFAMIQGAVAGHLCVGEIAAIDSSKDLAVLQVGNPVHGLPQRVREIGLAENEPTAGDIFYVLGSPGDRPLWRSTLGEFKYTVRLRARYRDDPYDRDYRALKFSSSTWSGNSGGPVLDKTGNIVGILSAGNDSEGGDATAVHHSEVRDLVDSIMTFFTVTIVNPTSHKIFYQFRENDRSKWKSHALSAQHLRLHKGTDFEWPEIRFDSSLEQGVQQRVYRLSFWRKEVGRGHPPLDASKDGRRYDFRLSGREVNLVDNALGSAD